MPLRSALLLASLCLVTWACSPLKPYEQGNSPPGDYTYCGALTATCNASYSGTPTMCSRTTDELCPTLQPARSKAFQDAVISCAKEYSPCILAFTECIPAQLEAAVPTTAQARVKADFCAACPDKAGRAGPCSTFFKKSPDAGVGIYGVGSRVLEVNDTVAAEIGHECIGVTFADGGLVAAGDSGSAAGSFGGCDALAFAVCANTVARARTAPAACQ